MGVNIPVKWTLDFSSERLLQLSDEMSQISAMLTRLAVVTRAEPSTAAEAPADHSDRHVAIATVTHGIEARSLRAQFFDEELFADPAWDMLLNLFASELAQHRVTVSSLCEAAAVPATTALRWIKTMTDSGLFIRRPDPYDGRRIYVALSPPASDAMRRYFCELQHAGPRWSLGR